MSKQRQGLNCTLSYMVGKNRRAYQVRANVITHGMKIIYDESQARIRKAFYPHRLSSAQFAVGIQLVGEDEFVSFSRWLAGYADYILDINLRIGEFPAMAVSIPSRDFLRKGVPLTGFEWGDAVGKMLWEPTIVFESAGEPNDADPTLSSVGGIATIGNETKYFYPTGVQLSGDGAPPDGTYVGSVTASDIIGPVVGDGSGSHIIGTKEGER